VKNLLILIVFCLLALRAIAAPPNILVILADDAGYADFGFQGGGINGDFAALTPNLDSLAAGGGRFSSGYVSGPVCCPSRAGSQTPLPASDHSPQILCNRSGCCCATPYCV
jgi:hypothetical protein